MRGGTSGTLVCNTGLFLPGKVDETRHVDFIKYTVDVAGFNEGEIAVVFGAIRSRVTERLDDGRDEFPHGVVDGGAQNLFHVGNGFECDPGIDVAWGPEDTAFYIQIGNAWTR